MSSAVQSLEVSYFLQMTEDEDKVRRAVASLLGGDIPAERQEVEGHYGNKIVWIRHHLTGDEAEAALRQIVSHIEPDERKAILGDLGAVLDEHNALYIRLSKQVLVMKGSAVLASSDPVRVKVKPRSYMIKRDPEGFYARLLEVSG
ncbi:MAG TPA: RNA-binding domain-containing protein [Nitrososphaerales archaeon]|nr:RNA-binding domain-containing protein [Nitrososphaerales archaeon]